MLLDRILYSNLSLHRSALWSPFQSSWYSSMPSLDSSSIGLFHIDLFFTETTQILLNMKQKHTFEYSVMTAATTMV